ncbi:MAG: 50S ribosomal protein L11 [Alphaproteobacteria bacterium]|nr:50S ribosomal protein L11 [Alphaproteobacteria bacterium]MDD9920255.1 50S ribosomal protein L11 [Alphaproteobacteria bacterium]
MAKKKVIGFINLQVAAGQANPAPPVGPALGQKGLNIMEFCKAFNAATQGKFDPGTPIPVTITAYADRTFTFETRTPPASFYLKKAAKQKKGASAPNAAATVAKVKKSQIREIAELKMVDLNAYDIEQAMKIIEGSARSMGYSVVEG